MSPKVSIIVPVYKVEKYISRCIDSIKEQKNEDWELLLIDDGSPDRSGEICDCYAETDARIQVFHKKNGGVSSARNLGLEHAKGEWICFIDSDDFISPDFLSFNVNDNIDVIQKSYIIFNEITSEKKYVNLVDKNITSKQVLNEFFVNRRTNALWDKIIRRTVIGAKKFNEKVVVGEDFLFFLSIFKYINGYALSSNGYYNYVIRDSSAMGKIKNNLKERINTLWENINYVQKELSDSSSFFLCKSIIYKTYIPSLFSYRNNLDENEKKVLKRYYSEMKLSELIYLDYIIVFRLLVQKILALFLL